VARWAEKNEKSIFIKYFKTFKIFLKIKEGISNFKLRKKKIIKLVKNIEIK
jgi:hypothetical protein